MSTITEPLLAYPTVKLFGCDHRGDNWDVRITCIGRESIKKQFLIDEHIVSEKKEEKFEGKDIYILNVDLTLHRSDRKQSIPYTLCGQIFNLIIPKQNVPPRFSASSCDGTQYPADEEKVAPLGNLWDKTPLDNELMVLNGDQLYCDDVFYLETVKAWNDLPLEEKKKAPFTDEMRDEVDAYYLQAYLDKFSKEGFGKQISSKATIMNWDDHDIFDGKGSYPKEIRKSPVFIGIMEIATKYYNLFQQVGKENDANLGETTSNFYLFNELAIAAMDTRSSRTKHQILNPDAVASLMERLDVYGNEINHLVVALPVPILYQSLKAAEKFLGAANTVMDGIGKIFPKFKNSELQEKIVEGSPADDLNLTDDVIDHWNHPNHVTERDAFLKELFAKAEENQFRVTFVSGDVHIGAFRKMKSQEKRPFASDPMGAFQVTSSASHNVPAPGIMKPLLKVHDAKTRTTPFGAVEVPARLKNGTDEKELFFNRNISTFKFDEEGNLIATLHVEKKSGEMEKWKGKIPKLVLSDSEQVEPEQKKSGFCVIV